jgi:uncharacterized membrane protein YkgB
MTSLLPEDIRDAVTAVDTYAASESFGVVTLVVLLVLLVEREALALARPGMPRLSSLSAFAFPLLVTVSVTILVRLILLAR